MQRLLALAATLLVLVTPSAARAAQAVPGGRYVDRVREHGVRLQVDFTMANDGKEFAEPSYTAIEIRCSTHVSTGGGLELDSNDEGQFMSVRVRPDGRFRYRRYSYGWLRGRFVRHGRLAVGTVIWPGSGFASTAICPRVKVRFRARVVGRPNASRPGLPSTCDPVYIPRSPSSSRVRARFEVLEAGVGCTEARDIARRWSASGQCAELTPGASCSLVGATCQSLRGGEFSSLAIARCAPAGIAGAVELVHLRPCAIRAGPGEAELWGINVECAITRSFPIDDMLAAARHRHCPPNTSQGVSCARIAGFFCTVQYTYRFDGGRCIREDDAFQGIDFELIPYDP